MLRFTLLLIASLLLLSNGFCQKRKKIPSEKPRLIILLSVEGMGSDFLYRFDHLFGEGGFKRLVNEGTVCNNAFYAFSNMQALPAYATLMTGAMPAVHGIIADEWFQRTSELYTNGVSEYKLADNNLAANDFSTRFLLSTTFSDELCLFNNHRSKIISVAMNPAVSVMLGGHTPDAVFRFNTESGNWKNLLSTSDSSKKWVDEFNAKKIADIYLEKPWNPSLPLEQFTGNQDIKNTYKKKNGFPYNLINQNNTKKDYSPLTYTPYGNTLTKDFAIAAIVNENLGKDDDCDVIAIAFNPMTEMAIRYGLNSVELEDAYSRLDKEIAHFLTFIDETLEKQDVLLILTSNCGTLHQPDYLQQNGIPAGYFDSNRAMTLLRSYLNAVYGKGNWVQAYTNLQIYLDHNLIEDSKLDINQMQAMISRFMVQFSGLAYAIPSFVLESSHFDKGQYALIQNSYHQKRSADILLVLEPGYIEKNDYINNKSTRLHASPNVPLIWYGWKIKRQQLSQPVLINDIAPTLCKFLQIPFPNGNQGNITEHLTE